MNKDLYVIKSLSMVNYLVRCGHDIVGCADNEHCNHFKVFYFVNSDKLQNDMTCFTNNNKNRK